MADPIWMTEEEYMAAMPAEDLEHEDKFVCKVCNKSLSTRTSLSHFTKHHDYDLSVVKKWLISKDGNAIRNKTCSRAFADGYRAYEDWLSEQYIANEAKGGEVDDPIEDFPPEAEGGEVDDPIEEFEAADGKGHTRAPKTMKLGLKAKVAHPKPKWECHTTAANITRFFAGSSSSGSADTASATGPLFAISQKLDKLLDGPRIEVDLPDVLIGEFVYSWTHPCDQKLRNQCPISKDSEEFAKFDLCDFELYLRTNTNMRDERSRKYCVLNLKRFFYLLVIPDGSDPIGVMCSIHRNGVMANMIEAPLMDHKYTWARSMFAALENLTKFYIMVCNRRRFLEAKALLQGFIDETLSGLLKKGVLHRKGADFSKRLRDSDRLACFPTVDLMKAEVKVAMARIAVIRQHCIDEGILYDMPFNLRLTRIIYSIGHITSQAEADM
jgi:hypothetical protein